MRSRLRLNLFLSVVVAGLGAWLWLSGPLLPQEQVYVLISEIDPASVDHIALTRHGKPDLALQRSGTHWQITSPITAAANPFRITSLLSLLQMRSISTVNAPLEQLGLAEANHPLSLTFDHHRFRFGGVNPLDRSRYVEYEGRVHLVDDTLYPQLLQDAGFFVDATATTPIEARPTAGRPQGN